MMVPTPNNKRDAKELLQNLKLVGLLPNVLFMISLDRLSDFVVRIRYQTGQKLNGVIDKYAKTKSNELN